MKYLLVQLYEPVSVKNEVRYLVDIVSITLLISPYIITTQEYKASTHLNQKRNSC